MKRTEKQNLPAIVGEPPEKKNTLLFILAHILTAVFLLVNGIHFILISFSQYRLIISVISIVLLIVLRNMKKSYGVLPTAKKSIIAVAYGFLVFYQCFFYMMPPFIFNSHSLWKYPFQKVYINLYQNIHEPDYFPNFTEAVLSDYEFDYSPSIMQGAGHYSILFTTTPEQAKEYEKIYSEQAEYIIPLSEYALRAYLDEEQQKELVIFGGEEFWEKFFTQDNHAVIYLLDTNGDWNHPHTSAVIIDSQSGKIHLSQLG
ncbi:MAG: hypothetical protein IJJ69_05500 [Oscillospiraceae bacterium]|nr:hypothetical protein [Oscillospiraceae bacterium]